MQLDTDFGLQERGQTREINLGVKKKKKKESTKVSVVAHKLSKIRTKN